jgi:LacI family transcriptional regulator
MSRRYHVAVIIDSASCTDRKTLAGIAAYAKEGCNWSFYVEEDPRQKLPDFRSWRGDGILANFQDRKVAQAVRGLSVPVVEVGGGYGWYDPASKIPCFDTDHRAVARLAVNHLLDQGFRRLAYCGFPRTRHNRWSEERAAAFRRGAREAGCRCGVYVGRYETARKWQELQRGLMAWLQTLEMPVGVMACNDVRARHVLEACRSLGLRVPEDVAVIGVDNDEAMCELSDPPLSSVEQGMRRLGYQAAALLAQVMQGKKAPQTRFVVAPEGVVARRSTDTLAVSNAEVVLAARFIREHACDGVSIAELAKMVGLSRSTIERRFKATMGRTIHAEIDRVRIERARTLLAETDLPLKQVAAQAGFKYIQYMTTRFRRSLDQTPREYRLRARMPGS